MAHEGEECVDPLVREWLGPDVCGIEVGVYFGDLEALLSHCILYPQVLYVDVLRLAKPTSLY